MVFVLDRKARLESRPLAALVFCLVLLCATGLSQPASAQQVQPTADQMRMLNQLPASQREAALRALREYQGNSRSSEQESGEAFREDSRAGMPSPLTVPAAEEAQELRAEAGSRLVVTFTPRSTLSVDDRARLANDPLLSRIRGSHAFELDEAGVLSLMELQSIPLLGLNESDIERRLAAEDLLTSFEIDARILDGRPTGIGALQPFGYEIFEPRDASLDPPSTGPVPPDYVLGPGDSLRIQLFGNVNEVGDYTVTRDGILNLPRLGPVTVAGQSFSDFRNDLKNRVDQTLIGTQVSVTMGELRTIRIFVLGDANRPGSYVVNSLATISSALYRSGGINEIGSLRNIQLKRSGRVAATFDLYDLLIHGDTSGDERLRPGDVIFIPSVQNQVSVGGAVKRPAIYETLPGASIADAIGLAGGLVPDAYPQGARVERVNPANQHSIVSVDVASPAAKEMMANAGDVIVVPRILPDLAESVSLQGHVHRPGPRQWRPGMRLTDLIPSAHELKQSADQEYLLVRREDPSTRYVSVISANLRAAMANPGSVVDLALQERDTVHVFSLTIGRQRIIRPILDELELQSRQGDPNKLVHVAGNVGAPGTYPLEPGMRVSDLIRAGGALAEEAYTLESELTRYSVVNSEYRASEIIEIDLDAVLRGDADADVLLSEHDHLSINTIPQWDNEWSVTLEGEVRFPGEYRIRRGETLRQVLQRADGLTDEAFPEGAIFLRESLRQREQEQMDVLTQRLESDLATLSLQSVEMAGAETLRIGTELLDQLRETRAVGRLVIDLQQQFLSADVDSSMVDSVELRDGDRLLVPTRSQVVTVIGEVQQNTSHLFDENLGRDDYIDMSGGTTRRADEKLIYVVRASGAVVAGSRSRWFGRGAGVDIRPGDTIVVPLETDKVRPLTFWGSVTQILYQGAIAISAIRSFDN